MFGVRHQKALVLFPQIQAMGVKDLPLAIRGPMAGLFLWDGLSSPPAIREEIADWNPAPRGTAPLK
jgi:hypothetical protein